MANAHPRDTDGGSATGAPSWCEPPRRLVVTWQVNAQWHYDPDSAHASEIEVIFTAETGHQGEPRAPQPGTAWRMAPSYGRYSTHQADGPAFQHPRF
jgi:hypothetical protein